MKKYIPVMIGVLIVVVGIVAYLSWSKSVVEADLQ